MIPSGLRGLFVAGSLSLAVTPAVAVPIPVDPFATYLFTSEESPPGAAVVDLHSLGADAGDTLVFNPYGDLAYYEGAPQSAPYLTGVFSTTGDLLPSTFQHRVPGAIDTGLDFDIGPTYFGGFPTDIAEDFLLTSGLSIVVPESANFLFVSLADIYYSDNSDIDQYLGVDIQVIRSVPEPGTLVLLGVGLLLARILRRQPS